MLIKIIKLISDILKSVTVSYLRDGMLWIIKKFRIKTFKNVIIPTESEIAPTPIQTEQVLVTDCFSYTTVEETLSVNFGFLKWLKKRTDYIFKRKKLYK